MVGRVELIGSESDLEVLIDECFRRPSNDKTLSRFFERITPYLRALLVATCPPDLSLVEDALQSAFVKFHQALSLRPEVRCEVRPLLCDYRKALPDR